MSVSKKLVEIINESQKKGTSAYDTQGEVVRVDGNTAWVHFAGGVDETPVRMTVNASVGDNVQVRVSGGDAFLIGNGTAPPTDDSTAIYANIRATEAIVIASDAGESARIANEAADTAVEDARIANSAAIRAIADAASAQHSADEAAEAASEAQAEAVIAHEAATSAQESADAAQESADNAQRDAIRANTAANGAVTSLGIVQGVVDDLGKDMDDMQTHVAMMDAVRAPREFRFPDGSGLRFADGKVLAFKDPEGEILVPAGLHVVPTSNGYFVVISNDGMYVYDNESVMVAKFGENIYFDSLRPQKIGGDNAYIEYYDSNNDGKADSIRIVGANISSSTGIPTKVSDLTNDLNFADTTAVATAKKAGDDAQADLNAYRTSNNARVGQVESAISTNAQDLTAYITSNEEAIEELQRQVDGAVDTWYYSVDPTLSNEPAVNWTTDAQKDSHLRDLYFNTTNGHTFRFAKENGTYKWIQIQDDNATKALADAARAQDTADSKRRIFVTTPTPPYDVGDLWTAGSTGDIKRCKTPKTSSQTFAQADWELASKYTDDTNLEAYKTVVSSTYTTKVETRQTQESLEAEISAVETTATEYADGLIEQEVSDRNSAITASANAITTTVSQTYATKTSIPTKTSDLDNDSDFATESYADGKASAAESNAIADAQKKIASQFATSSTNAETAAKTATITPSVTGWALYSGAKITVKFTNNNTATTPTLNVNSTGAKTIKTYAGAALSETEYKWKAGDAIDFVYDGTYWRIQDSTKLTRISSAESSITQTANSIISLVANNTTYTKPDGTTATNTINSAITQNAENIELKVSKDGVIASINASTESSGGSAVKISADKVNIEGAAIFASGGRLSEASLNSAYDAKGSASAAETAAKGYTDTVTSDMATNANVANTYASKTASISEEQLIYKQAVSGTNTMSGTTTWVTATGESVNSDTAGRTPVWTTKRPTYRSNYPVLFVAKQKKNVAGTVTCSTPLKDDTTTVIDGGHITTGTIDASRLNVNDIIASGSIAVTSDIPTDVSDLSDTSGVIPTDVSDLTDTMGVIPDTSGLLTSVSAKDQYYLSTSSSSATGGSWQDTVPTWSANKYIWTRVATTKTTASGSTTTYSDGVYDKALTTALSTASSAQTTANSAASSVVTTKEYYLSTSSSSATGGSWGASVPTWSSGNYIWVRFKIVTTPISGSVSTSYTPSSNGTYDSALTTALSTASAAQATANNAAPKSDAVYRTQRIYYRKTSSGAPGENTTWLSTSGTGYGNWSLNIPPMTSGTTKYPYLYTAVQTQTVSQSAGTSCSCSEVLLDDSTTVIDGGTIITGSINANRIGAGDIDAERMRVNSISAINSNTGSVKISANKVDIEGAAIFSEYATKYDLEDATEKIATLEEDVSDMMENLDLGISYQWGTGSVTVTAVLIKNGEDIHEQVPASLYEWEKETQNVKTSLGTGYQKVIPRAQLGYMSAVTVYMTKGEPVEFRFPDGSGLKIHGKDVLAISV